MLVILKKNSKSGAAYTTGAWSKKNKDTKDTHKQYNTHMHTTKKTRNYDTEAAASRRVRHFRNSSCPDLLEQARRRRLIASDTLDDSGSNSVNVAPEMSCMDSATMSASASVYQFGQEKRGGGRKQATTHSERQTKPARRTHKQLRSYALATAACRA